MPCNFAGGSALMLIDDLASDILLKQLESLVGCRAGTRWYVKSNERLTIAGSATGGVDPLGGDEEKEEALGAAILGAAEAVVARDARACPSHSDTRSRGAAGDCVMHVRTCGAPYFLFLTTVGITPVCAYVARRPPPSSSAGGRRPRVYLDPQIFSDERLFDGTVLTGEMVRCDAPSPSGPGEGAVHDDRWVFLADDCLAARGGQLSSMPLRERCTAMENVINLVVDQGDGWCSHVIRSKQMHRIDADGARRVASAMMNTRGRRAAPFKCIGVFARSLGRTRKDLLFAETERQECAGSRTPPCSAVDAPPRRVSTAESDRDRNEYQTNRRRKQGVGACAATASEMNKGVPRDAGKTVTERVRLVATGAPDVYIAVDERGRALDARVSVPTMVLSKRLREVFEVTPAGAVVLWTCTRATTGLLVPLETGRV